MNAKKIITIIVLIAALAGAIVFGWTTFFSGSSQIPIVTPLGSQILPHGSKLDFKIVEEFNPSKRIYQYPTVTPGEIGQNISEIIKP